MMGQVVLNLVHQWCACSKALEAGATRHHSFLWMWLSIIAAVPAVCAES